MYSDQRFFKYIAPVNVLKCPDNTIIGDFFSRAHVYGQSGYKHFTLIDEKTSIPLSVRGAYIATTVPYLNIWCLQYFPLIQRRQRNRHIHVCISFAERL